MQLLVLGKEKKKKRQKVELNVGFGSVKMKGVQSVSKKCCVFWLIKKNNTNPKIM